MSLPFALDSESIGISGSLESLSSISGALELQSVGVSGMGLSGAELTMMPELLSRIPDGNGLKVIHIGPSFVCAGVEHWLKALAAHSDPSRIRYIGNVVTDQLLVDRPFALDVGIPLITGGRDVVREAVSQADIVLAWGPPQLRQWLEGMEIPLFVYVAHGMGAWTRDCLRSCSTLVDHVIAVSHIVQQSVCDGFPSTVIHNGVDTRHIVGSMPEAQMREQLGIDDDDFVVGYVGRFSREKRVDLLVESLQRIPNAKGLFVGWGPQRHALMDLCSKLIPGRFVFAEANDFLGDYYGIMDALCLLSSEEGFGLVVPEAMLHGVPVISTQVGCAADLFLDRVNGLLVDPDVNSVVSALGMLIDHPEWAAGLGQQGLALAEQHFLARQMADRYQDLLEELWENRAK